MLFPSLLCMRQCPPKPRPWQGLAPQVFPAGSCKQEVLRCPGSLTLKLCPPSLTELLLPGHWFWSKILQCWVFNCWCQDYIFTIWLLSILCFSLALLFRNTTSQSVSPFQNLYPVSLCHRGEERGWSSSEIWCKKKKGAGNMWPANSHISHSSRISPFSFLLKAE